MRGRSIAFLAAALLTTGCANYVTYETARHSGLINANYEAADRLIATSQRVLSPSAPIIVATLVRLENPEQSSNLGRLISEHISSRFTQHNYPVVELGFRGVILRGSDGALQRSRELRDIAISQSAQALVVGTYAVASEYVFVSVKLVEAATDRVIASYDYQLPIPGQVRTLLDPQKKSWER